MAISSEDKTQLLKVIVGLFNAAPGTDFLPKLEVPIENGVSIQALAQALAGKSIFTDGVMGSATTSAEQATILAGHFGLTADDVEGSPASRAITYFTNGIEAGTNIGTLVYNAVVFLENQAADSEFATVATLLENKVLVASIYSDNFGGTDLATLQSALSSVTGDAPYTEEDAIAVLEAAGFPLPATFSISASESVNEGSALTFTVTASKPVEEDTTVTFNVLVGDSAAADQGTATTNLNDFTAGTFNPVTVTILAGQTTATFNVTAADDGVTEIPETYSVEAVVNGQTLTKTVTLLDGTSTTTILLTTGADNAVGTPGDDLFLAFIDENADIETNLQIGDVIDGGDGYDTLRVVSNGDGDEVTWPGVTITNVEKLVLQDTDDDLDDINLDGQTFEQVELVNGGQGIDFYNVTLGTEFKITNYRTGSTVDIEYLGANGSSDSASVILNGTNDDQGGDVFLDVNNIETINLHVTADTTFDGADFNETKTLNIVADANLSSDDGDQMGLANSATINVSGAGNVNLGTLDDNGAGNGVTVAGSGSTGDISVIGGANTKSITTGSGDDAITISALTTNGDAGAGDDYVSIGALDFGSGAPTNGSITGGDGTDTINITASNNLDSDTMDQVTEFEVLSIGGANGADGLGNGASSYDVDGLGFTGVVADADLSLDSEVVGITSESISITASLTAVLGLALKTATGTDDSLTVTIEGEAVDTGDDDDTSNDTNDLTVAQLDVDNADEIETITLVSNTAETNEAGVNNTITLLDTDATKLVVQGNHALEITGFEVGGAANNTIANIDASASAGLIMGGTIDTANISILGSEESDTLEISANGSTINAGKGGDVINSAAGALDTLIVDAGDSAIGFVDTDENGSFSTGADQELYDIVTGFVTTEDLIDLGSFGFTGQKASAVAQPTLTEANAVKVVDGTTASIDSFFIDTGVQRGVAVVSGDFSDLGGTGVDTVVFIDSDGDGNLTNADDMIVLAGTATVALSDIGF